MLDPVVCLPGLRPGDRTARLASAGHGRRFLRAQRSARPCRLARGRGSRAPHVPGRRRCARTCRSSRADLPPRCAGLASLRTALSTSTASCFEICASALPDDAAARAHVSGGCQQRDPSRKGGMHRRGRAGATFGQLRRAQAGEVGRHAEAMVDELVAERGRNQHRAELDVGRRVRVPAYGTRPHLAARTRLRFSSPVLRARPPLFSGSVQC